MIREITRWGIKAVTKIAKGTVMADVRAGQLDVLEESIRTLNSACDMHLKSLQTMRRTNLTLVQRIDQLNAERLTMLKFIKRMSAGSEGRLPRSLREAIWELE